MSEDRKKLHELCDKATKGDWWIYSHGRQLVAHNPFSSIFITHGEAMGPATRNPETGYLSHWPNDWDASYIVAVQPKVVRGLLDDFDAANANHENAVAHLQSVCTERNQLKAENAELRAKLATSEPSRPPAEIKRNGPGWMVKLQNGSAFGSFETAEAAREWAVSNGFGAKP